MLPSDCVQFQSDHVQSGVPAGQRVCGSQGRHLGPQRHQDPTCGARDSVCRYFLLCSCTLLMSYSLFFFLHFCGGRFVSSFIFYLLSSNSEVDVSLQTTEGKTMSTYLNMFKLSFFLSRLRPKLKRDGQLLINKNSDCPVCFPTDHSAMLWSIETGKCLLKYMGHQGSGRVRNVKPWNCWTST